MISDSKIRALITDENYEKQIRQWRKLGEEGIVSIIQTLKSAQGEWMACGLLILLGEKLNFGDVDRSLAGDIWGQQGSKIAQYGEKSNRLSEKQLSVIARNFMQHTASVEMEKL